MFFLQQAVNSRELDYSHFVSLPLAIHPGLLEKLVNFQNTILGITSHDKDKNMDTDLGGDTLDKEEDGSQSTAPNVYVELKMVKADADADAEVHVNSNQNPTETPVVAEVKAVGADTRVRVNITNIPLVSYSPKESKSPSSETSSSKMIGKVILSVD